MNTTTELSFEQRVLEQARDRGALDGHNRFEHLHLIDQQILKTQAAVDRCKSDPTSGKQVIVAQAIGQCLFELIVHCHLHETTLGDCVEERNLYAKVPPVWPLVATYLCGLRSAIETLPPGDHLTRRAIGQIYACLEDASRVCLGMTPERCLELAIGAIPYD